MSKYSKEELKKMSEILLEAKSCNDDRYLEFCFAMMVRTGAPLEVIEDKIIEYSQG